MQYIFSLGIELLHLHLEQLNRQSETKQNRILTHGLYIKTLVILHLKDSFKKKQYCIFPGIHSP